MSKYYYYSYYYYKMICNFCDYEWESRKDNPKACPRCKKRFDYPKKDPNINLNLGNSELNLAEKQLQGEN